MDQNSQNIALIKKKKKIGTAKPTLSFQFYFLLPWAFFYKMHILFFKKVLIILRWNTKHAVR